MKKSRFAEERMGTILGEADRTMVAYAAKKHRGSDATIYAWRKHFGQMEAADVKRLKPLELEKCLAVHPRCLGHRAGRCNSLQTRDLGVESQEVVHDRDAGHGWLMVQGRVWSKPVVSVYEGIQRCVALR